MAKCIQHRETKEIIRVSDDEAEEKVKKGKWGYTTKSNWRAQRNKS